MLVTDAWGTIGAVASVVAAGAALATVLYARATVREAKVARENAHRDHLDEIVRQEAVAEATSKAHHADMEERRCAHEAERALQRGIQLQQVAVLLNDLVDVARREHLEPPQIISEGNPFRATGIPAMIYRLRATLAFLAVLDGPILPDTTQLANEGAQGGTAAISIVSRGITALQEIERATQSDDGRAPS